MRPLTFLTLDSLAAFLGSRLPASALASWGMPPPPRKQQQHPVIRAVHVSTVQIRNCHDALLMETGQLLSDGTLRSLCGPCPLSKKMRHGETPEAVAIHAVCMELGERVRVRILGGEEARMEERESALRMCYPGLHAGYMLHAVDMEVIEGIPEEGKFDSEEAREHKDEVTVEGASGAITMKRHYWKWVDNDQEVTGGGSKEGERQSAH